MGLRVIWLIVVVFEMHWFARWLGPGILFLVGLIMREKKYIAPLRWKREGKLARVARKVYCVVHRVTHWLVRREPRIPVGLTWLFGSPDRVGQNILALGAFGVLLTGMALLNWWPAWEWKLWSPELQAELSSEIPALPFDRLPQWGDVLLFKEIPARVVEPVRGLVLYSRPAFQSVEWWYGAGHLTRILIVVGLPFVVIGPTLLLDWVFAIESKSTNFRSVVFGRVDASGVRLPDGSRYKSMAMGNEGVSFLPMPPIQADNSTRLQATPDYSEPD
jgi:hypothetical protein